MHHNRLSSAAKYRMGRLLRRNRYASLLAVEKAEQTFYIDYLRQGMTVFDIGANIGELTLLFSRFTGPTGSIHSFEASGSTFERFQTIVNQSCRENIIVNHCAVTESVGTVKLFVHDIQHSGLSSIAERPFQEYGVDLSNDSVEEVASTTVDAYAELHNIETIHLMKVDVEGAEYQVMLGADRMFSKKRIRCCVFEFGQTTFDMGNSPEEIKRYMQTKGYSIRNIVDRNPPFPGGKSVKTARYSMHVAVPQ